jgi:hypothetical protein
MVPGFSCTGFSKRLTASWIGTAKCLGADVRFHIGKTVIEGTGYAERLQLTILPWCIPADEIRWGRFLATQHLRSCGLTGEGIIHNVLCFTTAIDAGRINLRRRTRPDPIVRIVWPPERYALPGVGFGGNGRITDQNVVPEATRSRMVRRQGVNLQQMRKRLASRL